MKTLKQPHWVLSDEEYQEVVSIARKRYPFDLPYHNFDHVERMNTVLLDKNFDPIQRRLIELAILFHDCVYDPRSETNEEDSAREAGFVLGDLINPAYLGIIQQMILDTKDHVNKTFRISENYFLDADLSILAASKREYEEYRNNIRLEYSFLGSNVYNIARRNVLQSILDRSQIFQQMRYFEQPARANIQNEILELSKVIYI